MRNVLVLTVLAAASAARAEEIPSQKVDGKISWVYSYAEGQRLARATGTPLFIVFRCER